MYSSFRSMCQDTLVCQNVVTNTTNVTIHVTRSVISVTTCSKNVLTITVTIMQYSRNSTTKSWISVSRYHRFLLNVQYIIPHLFYFVNFKDSFFKGISGSGVRDLQKFLRSSLPLGLNVKYSQLEIDTNEMINKFNPPLNLLGFKARILCISVTDSDPDALGYCWNGLCSLPRSTKERLSLRWEKVVC